MITGVFTPDGKFTETLGNYLPTVDAVEACTRVCVAHDAADVLEILGVIA